VLRRNRGTEIRSQRVESVHGHSSSWMGTYGAALLVGLSRYLLEELHVHSALWVEAHADLECELAAEPCKRALEIPPCLLQKPGVGRCPACKIPQYLLAQGLTSSTSAMAV
jgi:hypothetical protein